VNGYVSGLEVRCQCLKKFYNKVEVSQQTPNVWQLRQQSFAKTRHLIKQDKKRHGD